MPDSATMLNNTEALKSYSMWHYTEFQD